MTAEIATPVDELRTAAALLRHTVDAVAALARPKPEPQFTDDLQFLGCCGDPGRTHHQGHARAWSLPATEWCSAEHACSYCWPPIDQADLAAVLAGPRCWCGGRVGPRDPGDTDGLGCLDDIFHEWRPATGGEAGQ